VNQDGYLVDLIKPMRAPPWTDDRNMVGTDPGDLTAAEIEGLTWHENAPPFESVAIDEKGGPLRIIATDPRVWAAHKLWLSKRPDRNALKRTRDEAQARVVGHLAAKYLSHLQFVREQMKMLPKSVFDDAKQLFTEATSRSG
jgi:hypothetical protein